MVSDAILHYEKVLENDQTYISVLRNIAVALSMEKRHDEALKYLDRILAQKPNNVIIERFKPQLILEKNMTGNIIF